VEKDRIVYGDECEFGPSKVPYSIYMYMYISISLYIVHAHTHTHTHIYMCVWGGG